MEGEDRQCVLGEVVNVRDGERIECRGEGTLIVNKALDLDLFE